MRQKFIKLFEDYTKDQSETPVSGEAWTHVRDTIQTRRPFVIIVFKNKDSYSEALAKDLSTYECIKQTAIIFTSEGEKRYPSVFFSLDHDQDFSNKVKELYEKFKIKSLVVGKANSEYSTLYLDDGTSTDFGNEIVSTLSPEELESSDQFKLGSVYYRFITFEG